MCHETRAWQENRTAHGLLGLFILTCFVSCRKFTCSYSPASYPSADGSLLISTRPPRAAGERGQRCISSGVISPLRLCH